MIIVNKKINRTPQSTDIELFSLYKKIVQKFATIPIEEKNQVLNKIKNELIYLFNNESVFEQKLNSNEEFYVFPETAEYKKILSLYLIFENIDFVDNVLNYQKQLYEEYNETNNFTEIVENEIIKYIEEHYYIDSTILILNILLWTKSHNYDFIFDIFNNFSTNELGENEKIENKEKFQKIEKNRLKKFKNFLNKSENDLDSLLNRYYQKNVDISIFNSMSLLIDYCMTYSKSIEKDDNVILFYDKINIFYKRNIEIKSKLYSNYFYDNFKQRINNLLSESKVNEFIEKEINNVKSILDFSNKNILFYLDIIAGKILLSFTKYKNQELNNLFVKTSIEFQKNNKKTLIFLLSNSLLKNETSLGFRLYYFITNYKEKYQKLSNDNFIKIELKSLISRIETGNLYFNSIDEFLDVCFYYSIEKYLFLIEEEVNTIKKQSIETEINEAKNNIQRGDLTLLALKHCYLHLKYPKSNHEITWDNKEEIAFQNGFTNKFSGKKLLGEFTEYLKDPNKRKYGSQSVRKLSILKNELIKYPECISLIEQELKEANNFKNKKKFSS